MPLPYLFIEASHQCYIHTPAVAVPDTVPDYNTPAAAVVGETVGIVVVVGMGLDSLNSKQHTRDRSARRRKWQSS